MATSVNTNVIASNSNIPSCGIYGNGMCLGGTGPSASFISFGDAPGAVVVGNFDERPTFLLPLLSSSGI